MCARISIHYIYQRKDSNVGALIQKYITACSINKIVNSNNFGAWQYNLPMY